MPYLIDGHNLIPNVPGLSLDAVDDEMQLVEMLQGFCRQRRKKAEVFFDHAPPGFSGLRRFGLVTAHFVRQGISADDAIRQRLQRLGKAARNWTVVSSDHQVQAESRAAHAQVLSSEIFAAQLVQGAPGEQGRDREALSPQEVDRWLALFGEDEAENN